MSAKLSDQPIPSLGDWITLPEAAAKLNISRQYAYKRANDGYFTTLHKVGEDTATYVVSAAEVRKLADRKVHKE